MRRPIHPGAAGLLALSLAACGPGESAPGAPGTAGASASSSHAAGAGVTTGAGGAGGAGATTGADGAGATTGAGVTTGAGGADGAGGFPLDGPVLWTTEEMLATARARIDAGAEPFASAWEQTRSAADAALGASFAPPGKPEYLVYYKEGTRAGQALRHLAVAHHLSGHAPYLDKAREILLAWADAGAAKPPASELPHAAGLVVGRVVSIFADGYALVHHALDAGERGRVRALLEAMIPIIEKSRSIWATGSYKSFGPPYLGEQYFNNHLGAHAMGLLAIGYALGDASLVERELRGPSNARNLERLIDGVVLMPKDAPYKGDPTLTEGAPKAAAGEIYDRYRVIEGKGLHYAALHLRFLTQMALTAANNGDGDYFARVAPGGETLRLPYRYYSAFMVEGREAAKSGYYAGSPLEWDLLAGYEIARRFYPEEVDLLEPLELRQRVRRDDESFGWTATLLFGRDDVAPRVGRWEFERQGRLEGWAPRKSVALASKGGALVVTVTGSDPGILSAEQLGIETDRAGKLVLGVENSLGAGTVVVFFATSAEPGFSEARKVSAPLPAGPGPAEVVLDLGAHPAFQGKLDQLRIDPSDVATSGSIRIGHARLEPK